MSKPDREDLHRLQLQLAALDSLELAFVYIDPAGNPAFVSSRAAAMLHIKDRSAVESYVQVLQPLLNIAAAFSSSGLRKFSEATQKSRFEEIELRTADDRPVRVLAYVRNFQAPLLGRTLDQSAGTTVTFYDLTPLQPFFVTLDESRRARALVAITASALGRPLTLSLDERSLEGNFNRSAATESDPNRQTVVSIDSSTDVAEALSTAVDIVDPLIHGTHRLVLEAGTPVLVPVSRPDFLRLVSLLLLETVDFGGPFGRTRVKPFVQRRAEGDGSSAGQLEVQVLILGQRIAEIPEAGPLETYLYRRYLPTDYRVSVSEDRDSGSEKGTGLGIEAENFIARNASREEISVNCGNTSIPEGSLSETARLAGSLAKRLGLELQTKLLNQKMLALSFRIPLLDTGRLPK